MFIFASIMGACCIVLITICEHNRRIINAKTEIISKYKKMTDQYSKDTDDRMKLLTEYADMVESKQQQLKESNTANELIKSAGQTCYRENSVIKKALTKFYGLDVSEYRNHELPRFKNDITALQLELSDFAVEITNEEGVNDGEEYAPRSED